MDAQGPSTVESAIAAITADQNIHPIFRANVTPRWKVANHVLFFLTRSEGFEGGSFDTALLTAFSKADRENQTQLGYGFPVHADLWWIATTQSGGLDRIREIASQVTA